MLSFAAHWKSQTVENPWEPRCQTTPANCLLLWIFLLSSFTGSLFFSETTGRSGGLLVIIRKIAIARWRTHGEAGISMFRTFPTSRMEFFDLFFVSPTFITCRVFSRTLVFELQPSSCDSNARNVENFCESSGMSYIILIPQSVVIQSWNFETVVLAPFFLNCSSMKTFVGLWPLTGYS